MLPSGRRLSEDLDIGGADAEQFHASFDIGLAILKRMTSEIELNGLLCRNGRQDILGKSGLPT